MSFRGSTKKLDFGMLSWSQKQTVILILMKQKSLETMLLKRLCGELKAADIRDFAVMTLLELLELSNNHRQKELKLISTELDSRLFGKSKGSYIQLETCSELLSGLNKKGILSVPARNVLAKLINRVENDPNFLNGLMNDAVLDSLGLLLRKWFKEN
jgi:hypothetical protein